jgi:hypothetical protein
MTNAEKQHAVRTSDDRFIGIQGVLNATNLS